MVMAFSAALLPWLLTASIAPTAGATHNILFKGSAQSAIELAGDTATVLDDRGRPIYKANREFLLTVARNPSGRIQEWDSVRQLVRISTGNAPSAWLSCKELKAMPIACTDVRLTASTNGKIEITGRAGRVRAAASRNASGPAGATGLPTCPGDPRCPKIGGSGS